MNSVCFFCSYFNQSVIPYYVKVYLEELSLHFSEIVFLTNKKDIIGNDLSYLINRKIKYRFYDNEGYDFGMWYKAFIEFPVESYERIGLINDSCILFKKIDFVFDWVNKNNFDYCGLTSSAALTPHIQSYFLIINKKAITAVKNYFKIHKIKQNITEVIYTYEVGLSDYLRKEGFSLNSFYALDESSKEHNPMLFYSDDLIKRGIPLIKKKIIFGTFRKQEYFSLMRMDFNIDPLYHINLIKKVNLGRLIINLDLLNENMYSKEFANKIRSYNLKLFLFRMLRQLKFKKTSV